MPRRIVSLALALACAACAGPEKRSTTPAPLAHGWVELALQDSRVPADPVSLGAGTRPRPPLCDLAVELDGEPALAERIRPEGAAPPYRVDAVFRFAASDGEHRAALYYSGCRSFEGQLDSLEAEIRIPVRRGHVTRLRFDGATLEADLPVPVHQGRD